MADAHIAVEITLGHEGGYVNDPRDPGGETNFGISKRSYPNEDIAKLTKARASEIYIRDYWRFTSLHDQQLANCVLDSAVNQGLGTAIKMLQRSAGIHPQDGVWGPTTELHANEATLKDFQIQRLLQYVKIIAANPEELPFLGNWFRRTLDV